MNKIIAAARIAEFAHRGQTRNCSGRRAFFHPAEVSAVVMAHPNSTELQACGAWVHDVIEDYKGQEIELLRLLISSNCGADVLALVDELTNPSKAHPELSRIERKAMDRAHLAKCSHDARFIKLADRACNMREALYDAQTQKPGATYDATRFLQVYLGESRLLLEALRGTDAILEEELFTALQKAYDYLIGDGWNLQPLTKP